MNIEDSSLALSIGQRQLDLSVNSTRSQQRRVQGLNAICRHDHLHIAAVIEAVQLIQQFQHGALHLACARAVRVVALGADGVDLVDEHNGRRQVARGAENITN